MNEWMNEWMKGGEKEESLVKHKSADNYVGRPKKCNEKIQLLILPAPVFHAAQAAPAITRNRSLWLVACLHNFATKSFFIMLSIYK